MAEIHPRRPAPLMYLSEGVKGEDGEVAGSQIKQCLVANAENFPFYAKLSCEVT